MNTTDIQKLADLARLDITDSEATSLSSDLDKILEYIKQIETAPVDFISEENMLVNVLREDEVEESSADTQDKIINNMPEKSGRFLKVKKIL